MEISQMQPIGDLYLKCVLIFLQNMLLHFFNIFLVDASKKAPNPSVDSVQLYKLYSEGIDE